MAARKKTSKKKKKSRTGPKPDAVLIDGKWRDAADRGEEIDPARRQTDLNHDAGSADILPGDPHLPNRRTEFEERGPGAIGIHGIGIDPDVDVARGARHTMDRHRVSPDDEEP